MRLGDVGKSRAVRTRARSVRPEDDDEPMVAGMEEAAKAARLFGQAADSLREAMIKSLGRALGVGRCPAVPEVTEGEEATG